MCWQCPPRYRCACVYALRPRCFYKTFWMCPLRDVGGRGDAYPSQEPCECAPDKALVVRCDECTARFSSVK